MAAAALAVTMVCTYKKPKTLAFLIIYRYLPTRFQTESCIANV